MRKRLAIVDCSPPTKDSSKYSAHVSCGWDIEATYVCRQIHHVWVQHAPLGNVPDTQKETRERLTAATTQGIDVTRRWPDPLSCCMSCHQPPCRCSEHFHESTLKTRAPRGNQCQSPDSTRRASTTRKPQTSDLRLLVYIRMHSLYGATAWKAT